MAGILLLRQLLGITQVQLADYLGVNRVLIAKAEIGYNGLNSYRNKELAELQRDFFFAGKHITQNLLECEENEEKINLIVYLEDERSNALKKIEKLTGLLTEMKLVYQTNTQIVHRIRAYMKVFPIELTSSKGKMLVHFESQAMERLSVNSLSNQTALIIAIEMYKTKFEQCDILLKGYI